LGFLGKHCVNSGTPAARGIRGRTNTDTRFGALWTSDTDGKIQELRRMIRVDHLSDRERRPIIRICEDYNDMFHVPGDKLTTTTTGEHAFGIMSLSVLFMQCDVISLMIILLP
jgi:hypothetical protein